MDTWEEVRHQVAIAGQVTDAQTGRAIHRGRVKITSAPPAFTDWLAARSIPYGERWERLDRRPDQVDTRVDGHFHFLDLPDGQYTLTASLPGAGTRYGTAQTEVAVSRDRTGKIDMAFVDLALPSTTVQGQITDRNTDDPVTLAEVRVRGSGERAFSNERGQYVLAKLEASGGQARTLVISARGYETAVEEVMLSEAGSVQTLDIALVSS